ncbi:MAG: hypothetical protein GEV05_15105 [Betaproteobacteria bacterium]|nr:hypothetical protein [Betaproteobacteria bacterium]
MTNAFAELAKEVAAALGVPGLTLAVVPHPFGDLGREAVLERSRQVLPEITARLGAPADTFERRLEQTPPRVLPLAGSWEAVNDYFYAQGWTDGLPIAVPTERKVQALLASVRQPHDHVVGVIAPKMGLATVEKIAVNAVMAGCEPRHFPVVLAAIKAMISPAFNLLPMQATTNPVAPMIIVNGPIAQQLEINSGFNVLGQGWKSNATIGRALRFVLVNIGGGVPGKLDKACHGQPGKYSLCIAENERQSPWAPFHVDRGYAANDSTVSVIGVAGTQDVIHYARTSAEQILDVLARAVPREGLKNLYSGGEPLIIFGPEQAAVLGAAGLSKRDVKRAFFERTRIPLQTLNPETITLVKSRRARWFQQREPDAVPLADSTEDVQILVAGGAGNHTVFVPTWGDTRCVTVKIAEES